jgi:hypothetical protein
MKSALTRIHCTAALIACLSQAGAEMISIHSPDQQLHVKAGLDDSGTFRYSLEALGKPLILPSAAEIQATDGTLPGAGWKLLRKESTSANTVWKPLWGKRKVSPTDILKLQLAPGGGACVILEKSN